MERQPPCPDDTFLAAEAALRARFLHGLAQRRAAIFGAADAAARRLALHRLAGAAGSFGFAQLGRLAREAEGRAAAGDPLPTLQAALDGLIDAHPTDTPWKSAASPPTTMRS